MNNFKEIALIASPLLSIIVAILTVVYNSADRKKSLELEREKLRLEREKISKEIVKTILGGSRAFERRMELNNAVLSMVSSISAIAQKALGGRGSEALIWEGTRIEQYLESLLSLVRENQIFTSRFVHESITREYAVKILELSNRIAEEMSRGGESGGGGIMIPKLLSQIISHSDVLKQKIRDDLEQFLRGMSDTESRMKQDVAEKN